MPHKDPITRQAYATKWHEKNKEDQKKKRAANYQENSEIIKEKQKAYHANIISLGISMIIAGVINDLKIWHLFCNRKKKDAKQKYPYSDDFSDEIFFNKMKNGCFYCGDIAKTIDRINSKLNHIPDNCVGCCLQCNKSKGNGDPNSFIRKAYYRARGDYFDDIIDIWNDNNTKPRLDKALYTSKKQKRSFTLSQDDWDALIIGNCAYCNRPRPDNKWNGVDRIIPANGYIPANTVSCCHDCNVDKGELSKDDMKKRNEQIAERLESGILRLFDCEISLRNMRSIRKKVCAYGKVYISYEEASIALIKNNAYVSHCISDNQYPDDIFKISDEFYEEYKYSTEYITKNMFIGFDHFYIN